MFFSLFCYLTYPLTTDPRPVQCGRCLRSPVGGWTECSAPFFAVVTLPFGLPDVKYNPVMEQQLNSRYFGQMDTSLTL